MLANFGYFLSLGIMNPVLGPFIRGPLNASDIGVGIGIGSFTVSALLLRAYSGGFGDRRGRQLGIMLGLAIHVGSVLGFLFASSLFHVIALRMLTGVGEAFFFVGAASAAQDLAPDDRRGEAASLFSLSLFAGLAVGPLIGQWFLRTSGFDAVWAVAAAAAGVGFLCSLTIPDTRPEGDDAPGPRRWIHKAALRPGAILACAIWGLAAFNSFVSLYAPKIGVERWSRVFLVNSVTIFLLRSFGRRLPDRLGPLLAGRISLAFTPAGLAVMGLWREPAGLYVGAILMAVGQSMAFPALMTIAINSAPASERGSVMGTFTSFFDLSFGLGAATLGTVAHAVGYNGAFLTAAAIASVGFAQMLFLPPKVPEAKGPTHVMAIEPPGE